MSFIKTVKKVPSQIYLSLGIFLFIFVFPLIDRSSILDFLGPLSYSIIIFSILAIIEKKQQKRLKLMYLLVMMSVVFIWLFHFLDRAFLNLISFGFNIIVFIMATGILIAQIVDSKDVTVKVILEAINGYLLIGVMFTLSNTMIWNLNPTSINIDNPDIASFIYYSFISLTTIGYGDIAPQTDGARMISVFFGLSGQLYLTIIMALIIGKYLNRKNTK